MKRFLFIAFLFLTIQSFGAARFWVNGGTGNWNSTTNWSATSGGASGVSFPTVSDDVTFDVNGNSSCTINIASACLSLTITSGYTSNLGFGAFALSVSGNIAINTGVTETWTSGNGLVAHAAGTLTSNTATWTAPLTFDGSVTYTLADNWHVSGNVNITTGTPVINSNTLFITGGIFNVTNNCSGTTLITFGTTGNMTWTGNNALLSNSVTVNTSGTLTLGSGSTISYQTGTLTYTAGTIVNTGNTVRISNSVTLNTAGMTFNNFSVSTSNTCTINSLLSIAGTYSIGAFSPTFAGTSGWTCGTLNGTAGGLRILTLAPSVTYTVTSALLLNGTSTNHQLITSSTSTNALLNYTGSSQEVLYTDFTHIDASGGSAINKVYNGVLTSTVNIVNNTTMSVPAGAVSTVVSASVN